MADIERMEFTDEQGRQWTGWRSDAGRIEFPETPPVSADAPEIQAYTGLFEDGNFVVDRRRAEP
jgi:hypothetical protein